MRLQRLLALISILACAAALVLAACSSSPKKGGEKKKRTVLLTEYDDARVGAEASRDVETEIGVLDDPELEAFVNQIGKKLLRGVPRRSFNYQFKVVDQLEPNAFALPGGYIFISRGLLTLANSEDELANVIGHEIVHAARRHAAARQDVERGTNPLSMGWVRAANLASYGRDMERTADRGGQQLAAAAGYDPMGMSTFLKSLGRAVRLAQGGPRYTSMFDSHPGTTERVTLNAMNAREIRWTRDLSLGDTRARYLRRVDGLPFGDRPEAGIFRGTRFIHPILGFQLRFPDNWRTANTAGAVGAFAPDRQAQLFLSPERPFEDPTEAAKRFLAEVERDVEGVHVRVLEATQVAGAPAARLELDVRRTAAVFIFFKFGKIHFRLTGVAPTIHARKLQSQMLRTQRSFAAVTPEQMRGIEATRVRLAAAQGGESVMALCSRTGCPTAATAEIAVLNAVSASEPLPPGETFKTLREEPWAPPEQ